MKLNAFAAATVLGVTGLGLAGCPAALPPNLREATIRVGDLPATTEALVKFIEDEAGKENAAAEENAILAVDRGLEKEPRSYELLWRGARACAWLTEEFTDKDRRGSYAQKGIDYGRLAVEVDPKRVEAHYYLGINIGQSAQTKTVGAYPMVGRVEKEAKTAIQIDEKYDYAGPARLLGTVYAKAPPWPASIGDIDEGIKYLSRAVQLAPDYPQNHLHYADALVADSKYADAEREYKLVLDAKVPPAWEHRAERWRADAQKGLEKAQKKKAEARLRVRAVTASR